MCIDHIAAGMFRSPPGQVTERIAGFKPTSSQPVLSASKTSAGGSGHVAADILRQNRNPAFNGFNIVFGAQTPLAVAVVDQVLLDFERMINDFQYPQPAPFQLWLSMGPNLGFGASANLFGSSGGKPQSAEIFVSRGSDGQGAGWFLDPTPWEHSEYLGNINNAFAGDAPSNSPAFNLADFYTVVALELTHGLGLFGNALSGWSSRTRPMNIAEQGEGFDPVANTSVGSYWAFEGPSIKRLLTSNNGGRFGVDFGQAIHSAGHGSNPAPVTVTEGSAQ
jgi:hypothetical protein